MSVTHALKWSFASELAAKAVQPVVFIVLARLLSPEDFGVMTAAMMVIAFSQIFWEAGMGKALIQRQTDIESAANTAFWINIVLAVLISALIYGFAQPIARIFFEDDRVIAVLRVMTLQVLLGALSSVHIALLQKEMRFKKLFWVRFATSSLPGMASIPLAWHGIGYWALVVGTLAGQIVQAIILWRMSNWRPRAAIERKVTREMGRFGAWVGLTGLLSWFYAWADSLVVGYYLGSHHLGLFRTGSQFAAMIFAMLFGPIVPVLYSHLVRIGRDQSKMRQAAQMVLEVLTLISVPIAMMIFMFMDQIESLLFGQQWEGIGIVIGGMALMHGYSWIVGMNGEFYRATGRPSLETVITATTLVVYLGVYIAVVRYGLESFVWARMWLAMGALFLHLMLVRKLLNVNIYEVIKKIFIVTFVCVMTIGLSKIGINLVLQESASKFIVGGVVALVATAVMVFVIERHFIISNLMIFTKKES